MHKCKLPSVTDCCKNMNYCKRKWIDWFSIDFRTPNCKIYMDSMASVAKEKKRHIESKYWFVIHPMSYSRFLWNNFIALVYFISFFTIPFMICMFVMNSQRIVFDQINLPIYVICWIGIIMDLMTGYWDRNEKIVEFHLKRIIMMYGKRYLLIDILSSLPYDWLTADYRRLPGQNASVLIIVCNLLPLLKLLRYPTMRSYLYQLYHRFQLDEFYYDTGMLILFTIFLLFWFSCLCYLVPVLVMHSFNIPSTKCEDCWTFGFEDKGPFEIFQYAFFIVVENIFASGYGITAPKTSGYLAISGVLMILDVFLQISNRSKASETKFQEIIDQVRAFTVQKQLPVHMKKRLLTYYKCRFKGSYFRENTILSNLSDQLRREVLFESCRRLIEHVMIFQTLPREKLQEIIECLKFEIYFPNDFIIKAGTHGDCMFFLASGTVAIITPMGKEICHLEDGAHFGEVALIAPDQKRVANVIAIEICEVYRLNRNDFRKTVAVHTELFAEIEKIASERIQRTMFIEGEHKRKLLRRSTANYR